MYTVHWFTDIFPVRFQSDDVNNQCFAQLHYLVIPVRSWSLQRFNHWWLHYPCHYQTTASQTI